VEPALPVVQHGAPDAAVDDETRDRPVSILDRRR
jgi:hypothetical protein